MISRIKRHRAFELNLHIKDEKFLATPRAAQRQWLLNRVLKETHDELLHLDAVAPSMIRGNDELIELDRAHGVLDDNDIMEDWQIPVMQAMAATVCTEGNDILEVGMGRGIASSFIQNLNPASHTLIECNHDIATNGFEKWVADYPERKIRMLESLWQDCIDDLPTYDGILFHTYPLSDEEFVNTVVKDVTFAAHFLEPASQHLKSGGALTYLTNEADSLSRAHQRALFTHFSHFTLSLVKNLPIKQDTRDAMWFDQMVIIKAVK